MVSTTVRKEYYRVACNIGTDILKREPAREHIQSDTVELMQIFHTHLGTDKVFEKLPVLIRRENMDFR